ncbi:MAG: type II secretion system F family protein [Candidatus Parvarchaeota archaeon]|nr:type II secretion system F family protein [Candidatus Rehaiarchaeum fermentans]
MNIRFENLLLKSQREEIKNYLIYAQIRIYNVLEFERIIVIFILIGALLAFLISLKYLPLSNFQYKILFSFLIGLGVWFFLPIVIISILSFLADSVAAEINKSLSDALFTMATNIRSGTVPEQAFIASIRPQFGPLNNLLRYAAVEIESGKTFTDAIREISELTTSESFRESMRILAEGIRSGAEIDKILESLATNILKRENLQEQMAAEIKSYEMFILGTSLLAAPLLYGISFIMITILTGLLSSVNTGHVNLSTNLGIFSNINFSNISINPVLLQAAYLLNIIIVTASAALINAELEKGSVKYGIVSLPLYVIIGLSIFLAISILGPSLLSQLIHAPLH